MKKIILVLIFVIAAFSGGFFVGKKPIDIITTSDTVRLYKDTTIIIVNPKPYKVIEHDTIVLFDSVSTCINEYLELYKLYASQKFYRDTFAIDSSSFITDIAISRNNLDSLKRFAHINSKTIINNTIINEGDKKSAYLYGVYISNSFGIGIDYNFRKYNIGGWYSVGDNSIGIKVGYKIFSKK